MTGNRLLSALLVALALAPTARAGEPDAATVMARYLATEPKSESVEVRMDIYRRIGVGDVNLDRPRLSVSFRRTSSGTGRQRRIRIDVLKPVSMAGLAMILKWNDRFKRHEMMRCLPGRAAPGLVTYFSGEFLQSHLRYELLLPLIPENYRLRLSKSTRFGDRECRVLEARRKKGSNYSKVLYYLDKASNRALKVEYYRRGHRGEELDMTRTLNGTSSEEWVRRNTGEKTVLTFTGRSTAAIPESRFDPKTLKSNPALVVMMKERAKLLEQRDNLLNELERLQADIDTLRKTTGKNGQDAE